LSLPCQPCLARSV